MSTYGQYIRSYITLSISSPSVLFWSESHASYYITYNISICISKDKNFLKHKHNIIIKPRENNSSASSVSSYLVSIQISNYLMNVIVYVSVCRHVWLLFVCFLNLEPTHHYWLCLSNFFCKKEISFKINSFPPLFFHFFIFLFFLFFFKF